MPAVTGFLYFSSSYHSFFRHREKECNKKGSPSTKRKADDKKGRRKRKKHVGRVKSEGKFFTPFRNLSAFLKEFDRIYTNFIQNGMLY